MRTAVAVVTLTVAGFATILSQTVPPLDRPPVQFSPAPSEVNMVVEGCLEGNRLRLIEPSVIVNTLDVRDFILEGTDKVFKPLRDEHRGHQDEVTGVLLIPADRDVTVKGKRYGRTRVASASTGPGKDPVGITTAETNSQTQPWLRMKVTSFRHLASTCSIRVPSLCLTAACTEQ